MVKTFKTNSPSLETINNKFEFFINKPTLLLSFIIIGGLFLRLFYTPFNLPISNDGLAYFWYAIDLSILGNLPTDIILQNNGWPMILSVFFSIFRTDNIIDYMNIQRLLAVVLSTFTIIIIYFFCKRFFDTKFSLFGALLFSFEPRIIQNSTFGITEPLYILLGSISLFLFFSDNRKIVYSSFVFVAICAAVRSEGIFLFIALSILFFIKFRKESKIFLKYLPALLIFSLIILSFMITRNQSIGQDGFLDRFTAASGEIENAELGNTNPIIEGFINFTKFLGWSMIPIFIFFVPLGFLIMLKNKEKTWIHIATLLISISIPALYAYTIRAFDVRYLFLLYPIFCVLSLFTIKEVSKKIRWNNILMLILICGLIISSVIFLELKKIDVTYREEVNKITSIISEKNIVINYYGLETENLPIIGMQKLKHFPILSSDFRNDKVLENCINVYNCDVIIPIQEELVEDFIRIGKEKGLTHIVVDDTDYFQHKKPLFLKKVFENEEMYPYLIKEFDSKENGYNYHLKLFSIDYEKFEEINLKK